MAGSNPASWYRAAMLNAFVVMMILVGCGKGKDERPSTVGSAEPTPAKPTPAPEPPPVAVEPPAPVMDLEAALAAIKITDAKCAGKDCARVGMTFMKTEVEKALGYFRKGC